MHERWPKLKLEKHSKSTNIQKSYDKFGKILEEPLNSELKNTRQIKTDDKISKQTRDLIEKRNNMSKICNKSILKKGEFLVIKKLVKKSIKKDIKQFGTRKIREILEDLKSINNMKK